MACKYGYCMCHNMLCFSTCQQCKLWVVGMIIYDRQVVFALQLEKKSIPTFSMVPEVCSVTLLTPLAAGIGNVDDSHIVHHCFKVFVQYPANKVSLLNVFYIFQYLNVLHALGSTSVNSWIQELQFLYLLTEHHLTLKVPLLKC